MKICTVDFDLLERTIGISQNAVLKKLSDENVVLAKELAEGLETLHNQADATAEECEGQPPWE